MALVLLFKLSSASYGLEVDSVQEVIENPEHHFVPCAAGCLTSVVNFHGQVLPVINLMQLLGLSTETTDHRLLVLTKEFHSLVLAVTSVERISNLDLNLVSAPPRHITRDLVRGMYENKGVLIRMLDIAALIRTLEQSFPTS